MDGAMLTLDGIARLAGHAAATDDYFEFRTDAVLSNAQLNELHRATIEIEGKTEGVLVESTDLLETASDRCDMQHGLRLTLRRGIVAAVSSEDTAR